MKRRLGRSTSHIELDHPCESLLTLNGQHIPFVNSVKYLGVIFDNKITWRLHIRVETVATKAYIDYTPYSKVID
jgi:hypothetical protein